MLIDDTTEWLEPDGRGGFASGTSSGVRTRRYHGLLLHATNPPTGRLVLVNGFDAAIDGASGTFALSTQHYAPDIRHPDGSTRIVSFAYEPWPTWTYALPGGIELTQEVLVQRRTAFTIVCWTLIKAQADIVLRVRPFLSGRDYHAMHHENGKFRFDAAERGMSMTVSPYDGVPGVVFHSNGMYQHAPDWYRHFRYSAEQERGLDDTEDLASPGEWSWPLSPGSRACLVLSTTEARDAIGTDDAALSVAAAMSEERARRTSFPSALDRAADAYMARRRNGRTILAGYPWFTDWGRDTFIALRGLCLATGRYGDARDVLVEWAGTVSEGMLPNRFPDNGEQPEFNSVDASLWYVIVVHEFLELADQMPELLTTAQRAALDDAVDAIIGGYTAGTRFGIRMDDDGLLKAGAPGVQLTWMDARIGDWVVTPRWGKPVEVQALWLNALRLGSARNRAWRDTFERGRAAFESRFWDDTTGRLSDVVDVNGERGTRDGTFRPNQILAIGGLPVQLVTGSRARRVVDAVEERLLTPLGLRSLAPSEAGYAGRYAGGPRERDAIYHQGTVWPWLIGPFVEAWLRVHGNNATNRQRARQRFVQPLLDHLGAAGLGHVSEIADADPPHTPRGCPFQAWSLGELIRLDRQILAARRAAARRTTAVAASS